MGSHTPHFALKNNKDTAMADTAPELHWHRVAAIADLPDGRVMTVRANRCRW